MTNGGYSIKKIRHIGLVIKSVVLLLFLFGLSYSISAQISSSQQRDIDENLSLAESATKKGDVVAQAQYINKVAYVYWEAGGQDQAITYFLKSLELNKQIGNQNAIKSIYNSIGMIYTDMQKHDKALDYFEKSFEIRRLLNDKSDLASGLLNIALSLENLGRYKEALIRLNKALDLAKEMNNVRMIRSVYGRMAQDYKQIGEQEKSFECMNLYTSFNSHINEQERQNIQSEANQKVAQASSQVKQTEQALLSTSEQLKHTQKDLEEVEQISRERQMEIDLLSKDKMIAELKIRDQEQQLQFERKIRLVLIIAFATATILSIIIYILYRKIKQQGTALKVSEAKFEALFHDSLDAFIVFDGEQIVNANDAAIALFDYQSKEQLVNKTPDRFFPIFQPDKKESSLYLQENMQISREQGYNRFEMLLKKQTGVDFFAEITMTKIQTTRNKLIYYVVFRDIDIQHRDQIELESYRERLDQAISEKMQQTLNHGNVLETVSSLKSVFITNIINYFKRPLLQLSPLTQMFVKHGELTEKQREDLRLFDATVGELTKTYEEFAEKIRQLSFQQQFTVVRFDIYKLLCDIETYAEPHIRSKGIVFKINKSIDFPDEITSDFRVLEKIIHMLLHNAFQLMTEGDITFELKRVNKHLQFEIKNTATVLPASIRDSLFEYSKNNDLQTIEFLLCQQLVIALGGSITVESREILGTKISFTIAEKVA